MSEHSASWRTVIGWGLLVVVCYVGLFLWQDDFVRLAHTTTDSCRVVVDGKTLYYHKPSPEACAAKGGEVLAGNRLNVLIPIIISFILSYFHGAFTSHFWDALGLKAKK